jgi:hypothetical protein
MRRKCLRVTCVTGCGCASGVLAATSDTADVGCDIVGRMAEAYGTLPTNLTHYAFAEGHSFSPHTLRPLFPILGALFCCREQRDSAAHTTHQTGKTPNTPELAVGHQPWYYPPTPAPMALQTLTTMAHRRLPSAPGARRMLAVREPLAPGSRRPNSQPKPSSRPPRRRRWACQI